MELALAQERRVSDQIAALMGVAREENDYLSEQFVQWFLKEQVEEVASMSSLLDVVRRSMSAPDSVEDYLAREDRAATTDPTAPPVAGGSGRSAGPPAVPSGAVGRAACSAAGTVPGTHSPSSRFQIGARALI